jgi:DNA-binding transcriptional MocR family regulator
MHPPSPEQSIYTMSLNGRVRQRQTADLHEVAPYTFGNARTTLPAPRRGDDRGYCEREAAAHWLRRRVPGAAGERIIIHPGTQAIIFDALLSLTSPGDVVLTKVLTYPGLKAVASKLRVRLVGVAMDGEGSCPMTLIERAGSIGRRLSIWFRRCTIRQLPRLE